MEQFIPIYSSAFLCNIIQELLCYSPYFSAHLLQTWKKHWFLFFLQFLKYLKIFIIFLHPSQSWIFLLFEVLLGSLFQKVIFSVSAPCRSITLVLPRTGVKAP